MLDISRFAAPSLALLTWTCGEDRALVDVIVGAGGLVATAAVASRGSGGKAFDKFFVPE